MQQDLVGPDLLAIVSAFLADHGFEHDHYRSVVTFNSQCGLYYVDIVDGRLVVYPPDDSVGQYWPAVYGACISDPDFFDKVLELVMRLKRTGHEHDETGFDGFKEALVEVID